MTGPGPEEEDLREKTGTDQESFDPPQKMRIVKAKEIAEAWPYDVEIPADVKLDDALRLYLYQIVPTEEEGKSLYHRIHFPSDGPSFFGLTNDEIKAAGGDGDYFIRLYDKLGTKWMGSKTVIIGQSYRQPHQKRTLGSHVQEAQEPISQPEEKPKEEDDMNEFAENQIAKLETRVERLETDLRTASKEASDNKLEALEAKNDVKNLESVAREAEKRVESEKSALDREITNLKNDVTRLTGDASRITSEYEQRLNSETKRIETDHAARAEGLNKEILDLKDRLHRTEKGKR